MLFYNFWRQMCDLVVAKITDLITSFLSILDCRIALDPVMGKNFTLYNFWKFGHEADILVSAKRAKA